jgi:hypothetical protein
MFQQHELGFVVKALTVAGMPISFQQMWHQTLKAMSRKIRISNHFGPRISSNIGFPEGDP